MEFMKIALEPGKKMTVWNGGLASARNSRGRVRPFVPGQGSAMIPPCLPSAGASSVRFHVPAGVETRSAHGRVRILRCYERNCSAAIPLPARRGEGKSQARIRVSFSQARRTRRLRLGMTDCAGQHDRFRGCGQDDRRPDLGAPIPRSARHGSLDKHRRISQNRTSECQATEPN